MSSKVTTKDQIEFLTSNGFLIKDIAKKASVAPNTISRIKNGVHKTASIEVQSKVKRMYARVMKEQANG